jgi:hypothetical protein
MWLGVEDWRSALESRVSGGVERDLTRRTFFALLGRVAIRGNTAITNAIAAVVLSGVEAGRTCGRSGAWSIDS